MWRLTDVLRSAPAFFVVAWPPLGVALAVVSRAMGRTQVPAGFWHTWLLAWGPMLALGIAHALAGAGGHEAWQWAGVAIVAGWSLVGGQVARFAPLALGLALVVTALAVERAVATNTWHPNRRDGVELERYLSALDGQRLRGAGTFERVWRGDEAAGVTLVDLQMRLVAGDVGWSWYAYHPDFRQEPLPGGPAGYTRITTPPSGGSYVTRRTDTGASLAGRTFRAQLRLRASEPFDVGPTGCRGVLLREVGGSGAVACFATSIDTDWSDHEVTWRVPDDATSSLLRIELRIGTPWFDVGEVHLDEATPEGWRSLGVLQPAGILISAALPNAPRVDWITQVTVPTPDWQTVTLQLDDSRFAPEADLRFVVDVEDGAVIEVRRASAARLAAGVTTPFRLTAAPRPQRGRVWFTHPNLAGHGLALSGLLTAALAPTPLAATAAAAAALIGVALTGSRAAWVVTIGGLLALMVVAWRSRPARSGHRGSVIPLVLGVLTAVALMAVSLQGSTPSAVQLLGRGPDNEVTRSEVLAFAWRTMLANPLAGTGSGAFQARWLAEHPGDARLAPAHGHNLWLHMGATFGLPGLLATLWLTGIFLRAAWRWGGHRGLVVAVAAFALQLTDATFPSASVYAPLFLALATPTAPRPDPRK